MAVTSVQVTPETRDLLKAVGRKGDTYDQIIRRLLKSAEYADFIQAQHEILRTETKWVRLKDLP